MILYDGLSPYGAVASHYSAVSKKENAKNEKGEAAAWNMLTALAKPRASGKE